MTREMDGIERIRAGPSQGGKRPEDMSPQELHAVLWEVLSFRDSVVKKIEKTIEKIPGLGPLINKLMDSISVFVFTTLEPFLKPIMKTATAGLSTASGEVIDNQDQYEVFNDPRASDPTHSFLSKDHFNLILNEPAGHLAKIVLTHAVGLITRAWDDTSMNVRQVTEEILECLFHPDFHNSRSKVQREMLGYMHSWVQNLGNNQHSILHRLNKQAVRNHENIRHASEGGMPEAQGTFAYNQGVQVQHSIQSYVSSIPIVGQVQQFAGNFSGGPAGPRREMPGGAEIPGTTPGSQIYGGPGSPPPPPPSSARPSGGTPGGSSSYAPPPGPPPSFPGAPGGYTPPLGHPPPPSSGYLPPGGGYAPNYSSPPPSFPEYNPTGGYAPPPPGGPGFPGPTPYGAPPPRFPPPPGPPPGQGGYPPPGGYNQQYGGRGW